MPALQSPRRSRFARVFSLALLAGGLAPMVLGVASCRRVRTEAERGRPSSGHQAQEAALRAAIPEAGNDPGPHLRLIDFLSHHGRHHDALDAARAARAAQPGSLRIREALVKCLVATERLEEAASLLREAARDDPSQRVRLASVLVRQGKRQEAARQVKAAGELPQDQLLSAGEVLLDAFEPEAAVSYLKKATAVPRTAELAKHRLGLALLFVGKYGEAEQVLAPLAVSAPGDASLQYLLGAAIRLSGDLSRLPEAAEHLRQAATLKPDSPSFAYELALAYVQLRDWEQAREAMEKAAALKTNLAEVQRDLHRLYRRAGERSRSALARSRYLRLVGDAPGAVRELERLTRDHPDDVPLALELAEAYYDNWETPKTLSLLQSLERRRPSDPEVLAAVFRGERAANHEEKALAGLERLAALRPEHQELDDQRADLLLRLGRYAELEALQTRLRDRDSRNPARHYALGVTLAQWSERPDRDEAAEACFREAIRLQPDFADAHYRLGLMLERRGQSEEAIASLRRALDLAPKMVDALRALGRVYALVGDQDRSQETFQIYRRLAAVEEERKRLEMPATLHRATPAEHRALGLFYVRTGRFEAAAAELEAAAHANPEDREVRKTLMALYGHLQRFQRHYEERQALAERKKP